MAEKTENEVVKDEREELVTEMNRLKSELASPGSSYGDWRMAKITEEFIETVAGAKNFHDIVVFMSGKKEELKEILQKRKTARARIEEIERELETWNQE